MAFQARRLAGYVLGFVLFYAPFALFQKVIFYLFSGKWVDLTVHSLCFRIQMEHIFDGKVFFMHGYFLTCFLLLLAAAFFFGPLFCGRLCPAGAFMEYLSKIVPERFQIVWSRYADITPIRYGMMVGYMVMPFIGATLSCGYCNFFVFDLFVNYYLFGYVISLTSSLILTLFLWAVLFGLFTKGGRGYCNFFCPVGAIQSLTHWIGRRFPFTYRLTVDRKKCIGCGICVRNCPMDSIHLDGEKKACQNVHNCILCGVCQEKCPVKAIHYGRGKKDDQK